MAKDRDVDPLPPHPATLQMKDRRRAPPPHLATVVQPKVPFGPPKALPPHPARCLQAPGPPRGATVKAGTLQRVVALAYTGVDPIDELRAMSAAYRLFAKVADGDIQEVQAMWYNHSRNEPYSLAVSANNTVSDKFAVNSIGAGLATTIGNHEVHPAQKIVDARHGSTHASTSPGRPLPE